MGSQCIRTYGNCLDNYVILHLFFFFIVVNNTQKTAYEELLKQISESGCTLLTINPVDNLDSTESGKTHDQRIFLFTFLFPLYFL